MASWREPPAPAEREAPREAYCAACRGWVVTVPAGTRWARGRCGNKRCRLYGAAQRFGFR